MKVIKPGGAEFRRLCERRSLVRRRVEQRVRTILEDVRTRGDAAVIRYTKRFDGVTLEPDRLRVREPELSGAFQDIEDHLVGALKAAITNVTAFCRRQVPRSWRRRDADGVMVGERYAPLDAVGVYVPAGTAPLVSTVYMTVVPARLAGVRRIVLVTPPGPGGAINPHLLVVASLLKVNEVYRIGGAQAIGALAYGTKTIARVDKIVGPGNAYVAEAKRQVFGEVAIDMTAGPSEVVVLANQAADPDWVVCDLLGEGEHANGLSILVTPTRALAAAVRERVKRGYIVLVRGLRGAVEAVNALAPEHLQIMVNRPQRLVQQIRHAGVMLIGDYTPTTVSDYVAGPSHVLPTGGSARYFSGLGVRDFVKSSHVIAYTRKGLERVREPIERLAAIEGLPRHAEAVRVRFRA